MKYSDWKRELETDPEYLEALEGLKLQFALGDAMIHGRIKRGWSQSELARRVGTKQANISRIESALANPTLELVQRILRVLELEAQFVPPASSVSYDTETQELPSIEAVEWPVNANEPAKAHMVAERRKKSK